MRNRSVFVLLFCALFLTGASRRMGTLLVRSTNLGAQIFVDGKLVGEVPMELPLALRPGKYTIKVSLPGHLDYLDSVKVVARGKLVVDAELVPIAGLLTLVGEPAGALVIIDGRQVGELPYDGELEPGMREIELRAPGFVSERRALEVQPGERYALDMRLLPVPPPPPPEEPPWYAHWWVWAGAGAVIVGGVAAAFLISGDDPPSPDPPFLITIEPQR